MKKNLFVLNSIIIILCFTTIHCSNTPIFAAIEQEVKLKKASITGIIRGIVEINGVIYAANGQLFTKSVDTSGAWHTLTIPAPCDSIATDGSNLYATFDGNGYVRTGTTWNQITPKGLVFVTGTNSVFATDGKKLYIVKGTGAHEIGDDKGLLKAAAGNYCITTTGIYDSSGGQLQGVPTDELKALCKGPGGGIFVLAGGVLYAYNGTWTQYFPTITDPQSVTYLEKKQLVLISGKEGVEEIKLKAQSANLHNVRVIKGGSSESSIPPKCYYQYKNTVGKWGINPIAAFSYTSGYTLYAGVLDGHNTKHTGLWGFYQPSQLEWNCE